MKRVPEHMTSNARALRNGATEPERLLWHRISIYRPRFTRQLVVGPYILDLACREAKLAIELDGSQHLDAASYDAGRTTYLEQSGWRVLRFWNGDVLENPDGVAEMILEKTAECLGGTHPRPLPFREGRRRPRTKATVNEWWERDDLRYEDGRLIFDGNDVDTLARRHDRPLFLYSAARIRANVARLRGALAATGCAHRLYYAMKCNRFPPLLQMLSGDGAIGIDVCSPDEMDLALACGFAARDISFTGTGVADRDLDRLLAEPDLHINCDSLSQIRRIGERRPGRAIGIRINPDIGTGYGDNVRLTYAGGRATKFGIYREQWAEALALAARHGLAVTTIHFHVGCGYLTSQLDAWESAVGAAVAFLADLPEVTTVNLGGGLGLPHRADEAPLDLDRWSAIVARHFGAKGSHGRGLTIAIEPGDYLVKDAGLLLLGVVGVERKRDTLFVAVDGGFNLHPEPAHYGLRCEPVACVRREADRTLWQKVTVAGNINEALDVWAEDHAMPPLGEGDRIALINAGGYGSAMASNHCMRGDFIELLI